MSEFTVTPETFAPIAQRLRGIAADLSQAWAPVKEQTAAVHFGRGDDTLSSLIQAGLQVAQGLIDDTVTATGESLGSYADGLDDMSETFRGTEQDLISGITPLA